MLRFRPTFSPIFFGSAALLALTAFWLYRTKWGLGVANYHLAPNDNAWPVGAYLLPIGTLLIFGGAALLAVYDRFFRAKNDKERRASTVTALLGLMVVAFLWPWMLLGPGSLSKSPHKLTLEGRFNIIAALWSDVATEYFGAAYQTDDARQFAREYAQNWQKPASISQAHVATHPPGAVLFFYGLRCFYEATPPLQNLCESVATSLTRQTVPELELGASALRLTASRSASAPDPPPLPASAVGCALFCAAVLSLLCALCVPAIFGLAAQKGNEAPGFIAAALFVLAPTLNLFAFTLDALVTFGVVWSLFFAAKTLRGAAPKFLGISGAVLALLTFVSLGAAVGGVLIVGALFWVQKAAALKSLAWLAGGFFAAWFFLLLLFPFSPLQVFGNAMSAHRFATLQWRPHAPWIFWNIATFAVFCGWPVVLALFRRAKTPASAGEILGVVTICAMVFLSVSGNVRGEVERLWLFFLPPLCVLAAAHLKPRVALPLLALQATQTLVMAATLAPLVRPF